ncbi:carbohydrate ABC transporter permease [Vallitalea okinawensis]|uniref:carbohydrate ABC transporter permease n=1 Tax=Vallitalea okinawensis TaxID=2078660 RepID=UPI000CFDD740|nr:carbohydrate ABC transporter permease [Vallitalea okinawensis]
MIEKNNKLSSKKDSGKVIMTAVSYVFITFFTLACLLPFILMLSSSLTSEKSVIINGFNLWPKEFSTLAYKIIFENPKDILGGYIVTILLTTIGTALGLWIISMTGYALQRKDFAWRNKITYFFYFTTLFSGGLVPYYLLMTKYLGLKDNYLAILLPGLMSPWLIILMRNFMKSIPHSITESAKIDGANDFQIYTKLIMPLAKPALATIGLFLALQYWNEWYNAMLFLSPNVEHRPLQLYLYNVVTQAESIKNSAANSNVPPQDMPNETIKMAVGIIATGPVIIFYPFVQKYFIQGITIGAVKG